MDMAGSASQPLSPSAGWRADLASARSRLQDCLTSASAVRTIVFAEVAAARIGCSCLVSNIRLAAMSRVSASSRACGTTAAACHRASTCSDGHVAMRSASGPNLPTAPCGSGCPLTISPRLSPHWVTAASARSCLPNRSPEARAAAAGRAAHSRWRIRCSSGCHSSVSGGSAVRPVVISAWVTSAWLSSSSARARSAARGRAATKTQCSARRDRSSLPRRRVQVPGRRAARASRDGA